MLRLRPAMSSLLSMRASRRRPASWGPQGHADRPLHWPGGHCRILAKRGQEAMEAASFRAVSTEGSQSLPRGPVTEITVQVYAFMVRNWFP